jgi:hypothetical protein
MNFNDLPADVKQLFDDILKYRIDPAAEYYGVTLDMLAKSFDMIKTDAVHAVDSDGKEDYNPILKSFVMGCGGQITYWDKTAENMTPVVIRGVTKRKVMEACRARGRDFYYIDTGYFGNPVKGKLYHRITRNDVQYFGPIMDRPDDRLAHTGIGFRKFRSGTNILLAPPSQKLLMMYDIDLETWLNTTIEEIKRHTDRPIVIRKKQSRAVRMTEDTMEMALAQDVHCLVTFSSIAAGEALLLGKPAITLGPNAAAPLCSQSLSEIECPKIPTIDEVRAWAANLAYNQFTEAEMRNGTAWRILQDNHD